jgi:hypothetical protein
MVCKHISDNSNKKLTMRDTFRSKSYTKRKILHRTKNRTCIRHLGQEPLKPEVLALVYIYIQPGSCFAKSNILPFRFNCFYTPLYPQFSTDSHSFAHAPPRFSNSVQSWLFKEEEASERGSAPARNESSGWRQLRMRKGEVGKCWIAREYVFLLGRMHIRYKNRVL